MIDYQKLKIAHNLMLQHNKYYCTFEFGWSDKVQFVLYCDEGETPLFIFWKIEDLIEKLQELIEPQPKYKIGREVWIVSGKGFYSRIIEGYMDHGTHQTYHGKDFALEEDELYPSKQDLVEAQIQYWDSQFTMEERLKYWGCKEPDIQINQHEVDIDRCQHESDGIFHNMTRGPECMKWDYKCKKCGEFYK